MLQSALAAVLALFAAQVGLAQQIQKVKINYPTRTGQVWPLYIAKEGGYYQKYGLDVDLVFGVHPAGIAMIVSGEAVMTAYTLEQSMTAASKDGSLIALGSPFKKSLFALMANKSIGSMRDLKGKKIGVSQIGDAPYNYTIGLIAKSGLAPRDVQWVPIGADVSARAAGLVSGRVDATMITAPVYFKLEQQGYNNLGNISDYDDIYAPSVYLFRKATIAANPKLPEQLMKAHAEAIKRFYDDKAFAVKAYLAWDKQNPADIERVYDHYAQVNTYERVPYILAAAFQYVYDHPADEQTLTQWKSFDFHKVIDNSLVDRLVKEGYFEQLFGPGIKAEEDRKAKLAYR
ncbi:MAG: ABC transporter substrate-binding protein [Bryobacterales bacterium]|nr:ABC transporter substrate-binding protein [Bryobacterales bacterium]MBV9397815.1 ABC transporter substrate-binding protein [Bryobacterales bacterium]